MPDKTLSKEMVNLLTSDSVSSPRLNSKHLAYVTQQTIAGDQVVHSTGRLFKTMGSVSGQL